MFLPHPRVKVSIAGSLRDREVAYSASDRQGLNFESCVWRTVSSQSSHHPQEVLLAQFSLYVHKGGLKPDSFHFIFYVTRLYCRIQELGYNRQDETRQDETRQDKTRQDKTRQDKTRQDKTRQDKTRQDKTRQDKTRQDKTRQDKKLGLKKTCRIPGVHPTLHITHLKLIIHNFNMYLIF